MINNREDYKEYLKNDIIQNNGLEIKFYERIYGSEKYLILKFVKLLRKLEFLANTPKGPLSNLQFDLKMIQYRRLELRLGISLPINVVGPGLKIFHIGGIRINKEVIIGSNFTIQPGVVIGQTSKGKCPVIGNNVYFAPGAKAFGKIIIGNNVIVAPNSVVVKDVPDNCVVSGVPAKIIKLNGKVIRNE